MAIRYVVLDFDGTCTQIEKVYHAYLDTYGSALEKLGAKKEHWERALDDVEEASPKAAWSFKSWGSAPAFADPYIQSGEALSLMVRRGQFTLPSPDYSPFVEAYGANAADWRGDVKSTIERLVYKGLRVGFISNSSTAKIERRLDTLLGASTALRNTVQVIGDAQKYAIAELDFEKEVAHRKHFDALPAGLDAAALGRPIYLRRGFYFDALVKLWGRFGEREWAIADTLFVGDIFELDLAMPKALGGEIHLITRQAPYLTCAYEQTLAGQNFSDELGGILARV